jgi:hypothetical protein
VKATGSETGGGGCPAAAAVLRAPSQYIRAAGVAVLVSQYSVRLSRILSRVRPPIGCPPVKGAGDLLVAIGVVVQHPGRQAGRRICVGNESPGRCGAYVFTGRCDPDRVGHHHAAPRGGHRPMRRWPPMGGSRLPRPSRPAAAVRGVMRGRLAAHPAILHRVTVATIASFIGARRRRHRPPRRRSRTAKAAGQFRDSRLLTCSRGALAQEQPHSQRRLSLLAKIWT